MNTHIKYGGMVSFEFLLNSHGSLVMLRPNDRIFFTSISKQFESFSLRSNFAKCSECTKSEPNKRWVCVTPQEQSWTSGINFTLNWMFLPVLTAAGPPSPSPPRSFPHLTTVLCLRRSDRQFNAVFVFQFTLDRVTASPLITPDITASVSWSALSWPLIGHSVTLLASDWLRVASWGQTQTPVCLDQGRVMNAGHLCNILTSAWWWLSRNRRRCKS